MGGKYASVERGVRVSEGGMRAARSRQGAARPAVQQGSPANRGVCVCVWEGGVRV